MKKTLIATLAVGALLGMSGCSWDNTTQQFKDAKRDGNNSAPAETGTMPDGFSNYATKCDHGNRVYVIYHGDKIGTGAIAVIPLDPTCKSAQ